jgi:diguanylate cyclase
LRYSQDKEKSAELLRLVLPLMARQSAAFHPLSYALWYEHVCGINPTLTQVLEKKLAGNAPLTDDDVYRLHAQHIVARDVDVLERLQEQLRALLVETARTAATAGAEAGQFGSALEQHKAQLEGADTNDSVGRVIEELIHETVRIQSATQLLTQRLEASAEEVNALNDRLERAQQEALHDALTGLKNRRGLERAVEDAASSGAGLAGAALLVADIDHFKKINDTYGHLLGDKVLRAVAQVLHANIKGKDTSARIGGEEFAALLPGTTLDGARALAEQIRTAVSRGRIHRGEKDENIGGVTLSIGVAVAAPTESLEQLIARADAALYEAKRTGRNRVCLAAGSVQQYSL